jgi:hypothetical protein
LDAFDTFEEVFVKSTPTSMSQNDPDLRLPSGLKAWLERGSRWMRPTQIAKDPLLNLRVAAPCTEDWSRMKGDARVRDCGSCHMKVFNLSEMTADEARALIARSLKGERVCARFYRRADGKVMTRDCGPGRSRRQSLRLKIAVSVLAAWAGSLASLMGASAQGKSRREKSEIHFITGKIAAPAADDTPQAAEAQGPSVLMGQIVEPSVIMGEIAPDPGPQLPQPELPPQSRGAPWAPWNANPPPQTLPAPLPSPQPVEPPHHDRETPYQFDERSSDSTN